MFRDNPNTTEAIIELIKTLPKDEQMKIKKTLNGERISLEPNGDAEYAKRLKKFNAFVRKNRFDLPKDFKFDREEAHERI